MCYYRAYKLTELMKARDYNFQARKVYKQEEKKRLQCPFIVCLFTVLSREKNTFISVPFWSLQVYRFDESERNAVLSAIIAYKFTRYTS